MQHLINMMSEPSEGFFQIPPLSGSKVIGSTKKARMTIPIEINPNSTYPLSEPSAACLLCEAKCPLLESVVAFRVSLMGGY